MPPSTSIQANTGSPGGETVVSSQAFPAEFLHSCLLPRPLRIFNPRAHSFFSLFCPSAHPSPSRGYQHLSLRPSRCSQHSLPTLHYLLGIIQYAFVIRFFSSSPPSTAWLRISIMPFHTLHSTEVSLFFFCLVERGSLDLRVPHALYSQHRHQFPKYRNYFSVSADFTS